MMNIKLCGVTSLEDAVYASQHPIWALGFNFYRKSPRYVSPEKAGEIAQQIPGSVCKVALMIDESDTVIEKTILEGSWDFIQVYRDVHIPASLKKCIILSVKPQTFSDLPPRSVLNIYAAVLVDAPNDSSDDKYGGTGKRACWGIAATLAKDYRVILAGGLNACNVQEAMAEVCPWAVDVASGIEKKPGLKDPVRINEFVRVVHNEK